MKPANTGIDSPSEEAVVAAQAATSDREVLHRFGYAQHLLRDMGGFSNFAISFSIISILTGGITLYGQGLTSGGPVVMGIGWPLVTFFVLMVAAALGELASAVPTSGALYHWSALLGGPGWGWITAWLNFVGLVAAIAGIDFGCAQFLGPLLHAAWHRIPDSQATYFVLFALILLSQGTLNHVGIRVVARLNDFSAIYHMAGVAIVVLSLALFAHLRPMPFLYTRTFTTVKGSPYWFAFLLGLLQAQWTYTGYDASAHTIEETKDARVRAPWGIYMSVAVSGVFGYLMLIFITLAIRDLPKAAAASNPIQYIFQSALGAGWGNAVVWIMTGAMWFCGLACITSTSRMAFAFSRDNGMPLSRIWAHVSHRYRTPAAAVWLSAALAFVLPCLVVAYLSVRKNGDFTTLYTAVTGISTVALYLSYGLPILLKRIAVRRGFWDSRANGPWSLRGWSGVISTVALLWIAFITVLFIIPPNQLTGYIFGGCLAALGIYYFTAIRGRFRGPVPQAASEAALRAIEEQFERKTR